MEMRVGLARFQPRRVHIPMMRAMNVDALMFQRTVLVRRAVSRAEQQPHPSPP